MDAGQRDHEGQLAGEVAVAGGVEAVGGDRGEIEPGTDMLAVDRQARSGQRPRAEREDVGALAAIGEPIAVAAELLAPRQELMGGKDRLRAAEVGVAGDN